MRRFRLRRKRIAAAALLPLAALFTTTALAAEPAPETTNARIHATQGSVSVGGKVTLRGGFPGAANAPIEVLYRPQRTQGWEVAARAKTGASGRYSVRVEPRRSGSWRAELTATPQPQAAPASGEPAAMPAETIDRDTGSERIAVRSKTSVRVKGRDDLVGHTVEVRGKVTPAGAKRRVVVAIGGKQIATHAGIGGRYSVSYKTPSTGNYPVAVRARTNQFATGSRESAGAITVYRKASASWYGPGLYGNTLGCGGTLTPSTIGVAHKTLPCGTKLRLRYGTREVAARVIDRGPYVGSREFDLTSATKQALGFPDLGTVLTSR